MSNRPSHPPGRRARLAVLDMSVVRPMTAPPATATQQTSTSASMSVIGAAALPGPTAGRNAVQAFNRRLGWPPWPRLAGWLRGPMKMVRELRATLARAAASPTDSSPTAAGHRLKAAVLGARGLVDQTSGVLRSPAQRSASAVATRRPTHADGPITLLITAERLTAEPQLRVRFM
eukprot:COSAG06_NODE_578_length_14043_cov_3.556153_5_plen_175_part_00